MNIPQNWTFKNKDVANNFDNHVREQLPWYDMATDCVKHFGRHYIPEFGRVYDIGASTGNIGRCLEETLKERHAKLYAIEESAEMVEKYNGPGEIRCCNAIEGVYEPFDFCVCFLSIMFLPVYTRHDFLKRLYSTLKIGGAIVIVDKVNIQGGYAGAAIRRLPMLWKMKNGACADDIIKKELSLAGSQRPIEVCILPGNPIEFFRMGEFCGWVIEKTEREYEIK